MKIHGKIDADGVRRAEVWIDPDGGYILATRVGKGGVRRMREMTEYRVERYEVDERGRIVGEPPKASELHQNMRLNRMKNKGRGNGLDKPTPPSGSAAPVRSKSKGQGG